MSAVKQLRARWRGLAAREKTWASVAAAVLAAALGWSLAVAPAVATLRTAADQHRMLDAQLQRMLGLQAQAQMLQSQPRQSPDEAQRLLEASVTQTLGTSGKMAIAGERVTVTLSGTSADALAQWLTQTRVNARALPAEARLNRNAAGLWDGTVVLRLPPR